MDNKLIQNEQVERYVLNQLSEEERATFRGQLMFDEKLRREVVQTKMLLNGIKTAGGAAITESPKITSIPTNNASRRWQLALAGVLAVVLISTAVYYSSNSNAKVEPQIPTEKPQIPAEQPIADEINAAEEEVINEENSEKTTQQPTKPAPKPTVTQPLAPANNTDANDEEVKVFANANQQKKAEKEEVPMAGGMMGFADNRVQHQENSYLEDFIDSGATRSQMSQVFFVDDVSNRLKKDANSAVRIAYKGSIKNAKSSAKYIFKVFTNKEEQYLDNMPKYQEHLSLERSNKEAYFNLDFKIELPEGLYYFIIEEEIKGEQDLIHVGKFTVEK